ncbi:MAG: transcription termination factor NusA [Leptospiraceae bacterium]|nr:transcription termination factor NusA [Leptospiraceae bacterium]
MAAKQISKEINVFEAVQQFCADKGVPKESVLNVIKESLVVAYKKQLGIEEPMDSEPIVVEFSNKNEVLISVSKKVVAEPTHSPLEITIEEAAQVNPEIKVGDYIVIEEKPIEITRIFSNQARQMVSQKLKEMERELLFNEYKVREGELTHGYFQRWIEKDIMSIDLGKVEGIMPRKEQNPGEKYKNGDRLKAIISRVELKRDKFRDSGLVITLSRASADFVKKLFEMEIPEIYDRLVNVVDIARIPSVRTKIVVQASRSDIDPVGACVGMKGVRIQSIVRELGNERIDIIQYSDNPTEYISNLISPAKPAEVRIDQDNREALIIVPDDSLSLAIGTSGSNVKLASQISRYKIDIKSVSQYNEDMTSPEAREKLERLFNPKFSSNTNDYTDEYEDDEEDGTKLNEIPGLSKRIIGLLENGGIQNVETLIEMSQEELTKIDGIGKSTAEQIMKLLKESVELVEEN